MNQRAEYAKHHGGKDVEIECDVILTRPKATLVRTPPSGKDAREIWIPNSQIVEERNDDGIMTITEWFATQAGLK